MLDLLPPVRLTLAHTPTPLEPVSRIEVPGGMELWIKRDDMTGVGLSGNKIRKLEFLAADALERGADTLITCGATTSNHARATAVVAARLGLQCHLVLRGEDTRPRTSNLLLDDLLGATFEFIDHETWKERDDVMQRAANRREAEGGRAAIIPEGGSNALGSMGYAAGGIVELLEQEKALGLTVGSIVHAVGSGGTTAGLALGLAAAGRTDIDVIGMAVCNDSAYFDARIAQILDDTVTAGYATREVRERARWRILDAYQGAGYGKTDDAGIARIREVARSEGLLLDPVYTGKAFTGMLDEAQAGRLGGDGTTVFLHTGGVFGLFAFADVLG